MSTSITFFNHYHNGDIFTSRYYVQNLMRQCPDVKIYYSHFNHEKVSRDLRLIHAGSPNHWDHLVKFYISDGSLAVNTWVGAYHSPAAPPNFFQGGINFRLLNQMWRYIYDQIEKYLGVTLTLSSQLEDQVPMIDYHFYNLSDIDYFVNSREKSRVLISNGPAMSGQSFADDMHDMIDLFAQKYPKIDFICTKKFTTSYDNIFFTDNIIKTATSESSSGVYWNPSQTRCDLLEISYLSTHCDLIVGKNSGPFVYCLTKQNLQDNTKTFVSFNNVEIDNLTYDLNINCSYIHSNNYDKNHIMQLLDSQLCRL